MIMINKKTWVVGHRGASADVWENSRRAFAEAWRQGADAIEGDFQMSKDGVLLCHHNEDFPNGCLLEDYDYLVLQQMSEQVYERRQVDCGLLPTAKEVMDAVPQGKYFFLEVKGDVASVPPLLDALAESSLPAERLVVIAFDWGVVEAVKQASPDVAALGIVDFADKSCDEITCELPALLERLRNMRADGLSSNNTLSWTQEHEDMLVQAGLWHNVWTVDDEKGAQHFLGLGVHSISSNRPQWLRDVVDGD